MRDTHRLLDQGCGNYGPSELFTRPAEVVRKLAYNFNIKNELRIGTGQWLL
jgi:hypothetical protein